MLRIRPYRPSDFEKLWRLDQKCFDPGIAYSKDELAGFIHQNNSFTLVAEEDKALAGFVVGERDDRMLGRIITIDVAEDARRAGVGSKLMEAAEERLTSDGCRFIVLEVAVTNVAALTFYKRRGYAIFKTIPRYYVDNIDAFQMMKRFARAKASATA